MNCIGIDPGLQGAWSLIKDGHLIQADDLPVMGAGARRRLDSGALADTLRPLNADCAIIEQVGAMPGQGVASMFRFGYAAGQIVGVIDALSIPIVWAPPSVWKRSFMLGKDKELSRVKAIETFPGLRALFARKKDHGKAEAALIALWGYQNTLATAGRGAPSGRAHVALPEAQSE